MDNTASTQVSITDIKMPFWSMVVFLVKVSIAAIPAVIILSLIFAVIGAIIGALFGGMGMMPQQP
ncbi:hypothetical protein [Marichromatium bheemlicum]|uniref:Uncharacterized protein n=1 Tax=Marichromatium bheemlicum TaxID=365339 RepID=A0ABX1IAT4_9GAMM|nr:hypothetical protein [Marichromatium bheemlicum]NKN33475.1 hypothetical protein [Marichromatium bheemlicum]